MTRIFISHSHSDETYADLLVDFLGEAMVLSSQDIRCTSDPNHGLSFSSSSISDQLKHDLKHAGALIVLATIDSLRSPWILFEVGSFWTTDKLIAPIVAPGLSFDELPGPLKGYRNIHIEKEDVSYELNELINQLSNKLGIQQTGLTRRREKKLQAFISHLRAWKSQKSLINPEQQAEIERLTAQLQECDRLHQSQIEKKAAENKRLQDLNLSQQAKIKDLAQKLEVQKQSYQELEQKFNQERSQFTQQLTESERRYQQQLDQLPVVKPEENQTQSFTEDLGNGVKLEMIAILEGTFIMGSPEEEGNENEKPKHEVTVPAFLMGKYPITQSQYRQVMSTNPSDFKGDNRPVEKVSWDDAVKFCQRLSRLTSREYRLPSEAEWEYACRAGTTTPYHFGENLTNELANFGRNVGETTPVGQFPPNTFGLYDMHGNVWEWCQDDWHNNYQGAPTDGKMWLTSKSKGKVIRGGSWGFDPDICRSAIRDYITRDICINDIGFRVVCVAPFQ